MTAAAAGARCSGSAVLVYEPDTEAGELACHRVVQSLAFHGRAGDVCVWRPGVHDEGSAAHKLAMQAHCNSVRACDGWDPSGVERAIASVDDGPAGAARATHSQHKGCATGRAAVAVLVKRVHREACRLAEKGAQYALATHCAAGGRGRASGIVLRLNCVRPRRRELRWAAPHVE